MNRLYSTAEVAAAAGISPVRVSAIAHEHGLGRMAGHRRVFTDADLEAIRLRRTWRDRRPEATEQPVVFSAAQVAARLRVSVSTVPRLAQSRGIGRRVGRTWVFAPGEIEELSAIRAARRGRAPVYQTRYSVTAAALMFGVERAELAATAARLGITRQMLRAADMEQLRAELGRGDGPASDASLGSARTTCEGTPPAHQARYSLAATAVTLGLPQELVAEHVARLGLGSGTLSETELDLLRDLRRFAP